jgi:hypothetical protein
MLNWPVQSFETRNLNTNYLTFSSLFGHKFGLTNYLGDIKVFDLIGIDLVFDLIGIDLVFDLYIFKTQIFDLTFDSF